MSNKQLKTSYVRCSAFVFMKPREEMRKWEKKGQSKLRYFLTGKMIKLSDGKNKIL